MGAGLSSPRTGDIIRIDLNCGSCDALVEPAEVENRKREAAPPVPRSSTPWEALYRAQTGQLSAGSTLEFALKYRQISRKTPRHNHQISGSASL